jgi:hypothetical protein
VEATAVKQPDRSTQQSELEQRNGNESTRDRERRAGDPQPEVDREDPKPEIQRPDIEQPKRRREDVDPDSASSDVDRDD